MKSNNFTAENAENAERNEYDSAGQATAESGRPKEYGKMTEIDAANVRK